LGTKITENIKEEILSWPGVTSNPYPLGGIEFRTHTHKLADLPFPIEIRKQLIISGKVLPHIIYPESKWVSYIIHSEDISKVEDLFRLQIRQIKN
jgi:hypothetical protein